MTPTLRALACAAAVSLLHGTLTAPRAVQFGQESYDLAIDAATLEGVVHGSAAGPAQWSMPLLGGGFADAVVERVAIHQPRDESPLPFTRFRAVSADGLREMRLVHWHAANQRIETDLVYLSEREQVAGAYDGARFRLSRADPQEAFAPCVALPVLDAVPRVDPFGADGVFRATSVQLPPRAVRVVFVPTDAFVADASQPDLRHPDRVLRVLWTALRNLNAAAGILHRELNVELEPVLSWNVVSTGPDWDANNAPSNFALIRKAIGRFCGAECANDLGHALVGTGERGWGRIAGACSPADRFAGYSPNGKAKVIAHELAHQLGAYHTFNAGEAWHREASVEPSTGITVMAGLRRYYLHVWSAGEVLQFLQTPACAALGSVGLTSNTTPKFRDPPSRLSVPPGTPVRVDLQASDEDGDQVRLRCEGIDKAATEGAVPPVLGSSAEVTDGAVVMPELLDLMHGGRLAASAPGHSLRMACTARDHKGGLAIARIAVEVIGADPFAAQVARGGPGQPIVVTWNDPGAAAGEVSVRSVRLQLVDARGTVVPWVAGASGGSHRAALPRGLAPGRWRVWVQPTGRPFFALSAAFDVP